MQRPRTPTQGLRSTKAAQRRKSLVPTATRSTLRTRRAVTPRPPTLSERTAVVELSEAERGALPPSDPPATAPQPTPGPPATPSDDLAGADDLPSAGGPGASPVPSLVALALGASLTPAPEEGPTQSGGPGETLLADSPEPEPRSGADSLPSPTQLGAAGEALLSLLDAVGGLLYVADPDTHELLFANRRLRGQAGVAHSKCHAALQGRNEPCPFCSNSVIFAPEAGDEPYVWEWLNPRDERWYRCVDRAIQWPDGRRVRAQLAIDITAAKLHQRQVARRLTLRRAATRVATRFVGQRSRDVVIPAALEDLGTSLAVSRASLVLLSEDRTTLDKRYEWCAPGVAPQIKFLQGIPVQALPWSQEQLARGATIELGDVRELPDAAVAERRMLGTQDIRAMLAVPLLGPLRPLGYVSVECVRGPRAWSNAEVGLVEVAAGAMAAFLVRLQAQDALRLSEVSYRQLVEAAPLGILRFERDGRISHVNPPLLGILGSPSAAATRAINLLEFAPLQAAGISDKIADCLRTGAGGVHESDYRTAWGKQVHLRYHVRALHNDHGELVGGLALVEDLRRGEQEGE